MQILFLSVMGPWTYPVSLLLRSGSSQLWSLVKKKWIPGPEIPEKYILWNTCSLALNSSTVLFVGARKMNGTEFGNDALFYNPNNVTLSYDFKTNLWFEHDQLSFPTINHYYDYYTADFTCAIYFEKREKM